jgi:hypothetical protein
MARNNADATSKYQLLMSNSYFEVPAAAPLQTAFYSDKRIAGGKVAFLG